MASFLSSASSWLGRSQVLSNYAIQDASSSSSGSHSGTPVKIGLWTVSSAKHRSSGKSVSIWSYEKAAAGGGGRSGAGGSSRARAEALIIEQLKAEVSKLTRMRMPCVLETTEPLEETRSGLIWASEPVTCSLRAALAASSTSSRERLDAYNLELDEVELQKGLLQVAKALQFLHDSARVVHGNITPDAIIISAKGDWKLGALTFSRPIGTTQDSSLSYDDVDSSLPQYVQPNLDYAAPELVLDREALAPPADLWSLGCVSHALLAQGGKPPFQNRSSTHTYRSNIDRLEMTRASWTMLGDEASGLLNSLLQRHPSQRPTAAALPTTCSFFSSILVSTLRFLDRDHFPSKSNSEQLSFLRGLKTVLPRFSERVRQHRILPALLEQGLGKGMRRELVPVLLPNIFYMAQDLPRDQFQSAVLPYLKQLFVVSPQDSPESAFALLEYLPVLQQKCGAAMFKDEIGPLLLSLLSSTHPPLVIRALQAIPPLCQDRPSGQQASFDYVTTRDVLFPKVSEVFAKTTVLGVKVAGLVCLGGMVPILDKHTLTDKIVPLLSKIKTKEPSVLLSALTIFQLLSDKLTDPTLISTLVLPQLWVMSSAPLLNEAQYQKFMALIDGLSRTVREERLKELRANARAVQGAEQKDASSLTWEELVRGQAQTSTSPVISTSSSSHNVLPDLFSSSLTPDIDSNSRPTTPASAVGEPLRSSASTTAKKSSLGARPVPSSTFDSSAFIAPPMEPLRPNSTGGSAARVTSPLQQSSASQGPNYSSLNLSMSSAPLQASASESSTAGWKPTAPLVSGARSFTPSASPGLASPGSTAPQSATSWSMAPPPSFSGSSVMQPMRPSSRNTTASPKPQGGWGDLDPLS